MESTPELPEEPEDRSRRRPLSVREVEGDMSSLMELEYREEPQERSEEDLEEMELP